MEIQVGAILLQMLNFGILAGALTFLLLKPVRKVLDERSQKVAAGQKAAQEALTTQEQSEIKAEEVIKKAQKEGRAIVDEARKDATHLANEAESSAKVKAKEIVNKAQADAKAEKAALIASAQSEVEKMSVAIAGEILEAELDTKKHAQLIKKSLEKIKKA